MQAREAAILALLKWEQDDAYAHMALQDIFRLHDILPADRGLTEEITYGVIRNKELLDHNIRHYSKIRFKKISIHILQILRIGLYQIYFLDRIPVSAAVNESVKLAKKYGHQASAGFVNGVLRSAANHGMIYANSNELSVVLSTNHSFPVSLTEKWISLFKDLTENVMKACNTPAPIYLRASQEVFHKKLTPHDKIPMVYQAETLDEEILAMIHNGLLSPQDAGFSLPVLALDPKPGMCVLDACAAPGGKTVHIAQKMKNDGHVTAWDIHEHKLPLIQNAQKRLGLSIIETQLHDSSVYDSQFKHKFDRILLDVPCSGWGVIRRRPDIKWREPDRFDKLPELQYNILNACKSYLKPGGVLVYSTCTFNPSENHEITERFLSENQEFSRYTLPIDFPIPSENGEISLFPGMYGCDGMYMATLTFGG